MGHTPESFKARHCRTCGKIMAPQIVQIQRGFDQFTGQQVAPTYTAHYKCEVPIKIFGFTIGVRETHEDYIAWGPSAPAPDTDIIRRW